jgi:hypothetical protein
MRMNPAEIAELQKMLDGIVSMTKPQAEEPSTADEPPAGGVRQAPPVAAPETPELELDDYNELEAEEIIALLGSLERRELEALRELESDSRARASVLHAIDSVLARAPA